MSNGGIAQSEWRPLVAPGTTHSLSCVKVASGFALDCHAQTNRLGGREGGLRENESVYCEDREQRQHVITTAQQCHRDVMTIITITDDVKLSKLLPPRL